MLKGNRPVVALHDRVDDGQPPTVLSEGTTARLLLGEPDSVENSAARRFAALVPFRRSLAVAHIEHKVRTFYGSLENHKPFAGVEYTRKVGAGRGRFLIP